MKQMQKGKNSLRSRRIRRVKQILIILLLIIIFFIGRFIYKVQENGGGITGIIATTLGHDENTVNKLPKLYCLILGQSQNLTDTIILASYDPKTQEAAMLSIPRDTFIGENENTATPWDKINAVYQTGVENVLEDVRNLTGVDVHYYVMVDTEALKVLVDEIGGVTFNVPIDMKYTDRKQNLYINLKAGEQLLDGNKAEQVVRFRHNSNGTTYPSSYGVEDIGRMKTQRAFLTALAKQVLVPENITKIPNFIDIAQKYVKTNLDIDAVKDYIPYAVNFDTDKIKTDKVPGTAQYIGAPGNKYSFYVANKTKTKQVVNKLFFAHESEEDGNTISNQIDNSISNDTNTSEVTEKTQIDKSKINVEVLNGSGNSANLTEVVSELKAAGYTVKKTSQTTSTNQTVVINRKEIEDIGVLEDMKKIADIEEMITGQASGNISITIILGTDYVM